MQAGSMAKRIPVYLTRAACPAKQAEKYMREIVAMRWKKTLLVHEERNKRHLHDASVEIDDLHSSCLSMSSHC